MIIENVRSKLNSHIVRSFSYSDVITKAIKIEY